MKVLLLALIFTSCVGNSGEVTVKRNNGRSLVDSISVNCIGDYKMCERKYKEGRSCSYWSFGRNNFQIDCKLYDALKKDLKQIQQ